jgi:hypothetical protein
MAMRLIASGTRSCRRATIIPSARSVRLIPDVDPSIAPGRRLRRRCVPTFGSSSGGQTVPPATTTSSRRAATDQFNFAPYNFYQRTDERYTFGAFADYEISPGAHPYLEAMFMDDTSNSQIAPSGSFNSVTTIACDNALLSAQELATICGPGQTFVGSLNGMSGLTLTTTRIARRNVEGGGRQDTSTYRVPHRRRHQGQPAQGPSYAPLPVRHVRFSETTNDFRSRLGRATDVIATLGGVQVARERLPDCSAARLSPGSPGCVPYNVFRKVVLPRKR